MLEGVHGDDGAEGATWEWEGFDIRDLIDARPRADVDAQIVAAGKETAQVGDFFLARNLIGTDFQNGPRQFKALGHGPRHAVEKLVHAGGSLEPCPASA